MSCISLFLCFQTMWFRSGCPFSAQDSCVKDILTFFSQWGNWGSSLATAKGSVAALELNCASDESFLPKGIRQPNVFADISKLLQFAGSMSSVPALLRGCWQKEGPCFPGLLRGNFLMPPAKDCKAFGICANKQKVFGKASWHFYFFFPRSAQDVLQPLWARIDAGFWHVVCWRLQAVAEASGVQLAFKPGFIGRKLSGPAGGRHDLVTLSGNRAGLVWSKGEYFQGNMRFLGVFQSQGKSKNFQSNCLAFPG